MPTLYDDSNYKSLEPDSYGRYEFQGERLCLCVPPVAAPGTIAHAPAAEFALIPRSEWPDRIREKDRNKSWLEDLVRDVVPCNDQDGLGYCHAYGTVMAMQCARLIQGHPYVELSAESIGGPITGWRNRGADPTDDIEWAAKSGACPASYMDAPHSLSPRKWKNGWEQAAMDYRVQEWRDLRVFEDKIFDAAVTACLLGVACSVGYIWWSHFVSGFYRVADLGGGKFAGRIRNNWGSGWEDDGFADFAEGKGTPDWAFVSYAVTPKD